MDKKWSVTYENLDSSFSYVFDGKCASENCRNG